MHSPLTARGRWSFPRLLVPALVVLVTLASCGGSGKGGSQVQWIEGTAPPDLLAQVNGAPTLAPTQPASNPVPTATQGAPAAAATATTAPAVPTATATTPPAPTQPAVTGVKLTAAQLAEFQPNELGKIPVLEYHQIVTDPSLEAQFVRTADHFRADLQWLYDHDFYVIPLKDLVADSIRAPAGKHPVVLTFDDSTTGQFRYLINADGSTTIDPDSAVGVMEAFYAAHPDFGRGGFFAVLPQKSFCFSWQGEEADTDQQTYCAQKLTYLLDHGYEVGNHTLNHTDLLDVDDDTFRSEIAGAIDLFQTYDPRIEANLMAMPYGNYPDKDKHQQQRTWLRDGFSWNGKDYQILACLEVGANPTDSPASTDYDPMWIARIQAWDADLKGDNPSLKDATALDEWFSSFASDPSQLYTSDGDPNTITVPNDDNLSVAFQGVLNTDKIASEGKELVRY